MNRSTNCLVLLAPFHLTAFEEGSIKMSFIMSFQLYCHRYCFICHIIYDFSQAIFFPSMLWFAIRLSVVMLLLNCLVHCAVPNSSLRENQPIAKEQSHNELKSTSAKPKRPTTASKRTATPTVKTTRTKETTKKTTTPALVNEFSLEEILFKGRQSSKKTFVHLFF